MFDLKMECGKFYCIDYNEEVIKENLFCFVLVRVCLWFGEIGYNFFIDNCELFVIFCKKGVERS